MATNYEVLLEKMRGEALAVQGVIDLIVITKDGKVKLYDYKTDRLTKEELNSYELAQEQLSAKHAQQLAKKCLVKNATVFKFIRPIPQSFTILTFPTI